MAMNLMRSIAEVSELSAVHVLSEPIADKASSLLSCLRTKLSTMAFRPVWVLSLAARLPNFYNRYLICKTVLHLLVGMGISANRLAEPNVNMQTLPFAPRSSVPYLYLFNLLILLSWSVYELKRVRKRLRAEDKLVSRWRQRR